MSEIDEREPLAGATSGTGVPPVTEGSGSPPPAGDGAVQEELVALRRRVAELESGRRSAAAYRGRQVASTVFLILTILSVVLATTAVWVGQTLFQTDRFMALVQPAIGSDDLDQAVSDRLSAEVGEALALEERIGVALDELQTALGDQLAVALGVTDAQRARLQQLPLPQLDQLAEPIASGLQARIDARIEQIVGSERFQELLLDATREAHEIAVEVVRGDLEDRPNVVVEDGTVTLDLVPAVAAVLTELADEGLEELGVEEVPFIDPTADPEVRLARLVDAVGVDLPEDFGQVTLMRASDLAELQSAARLMDQLVWLTVLTVLVLAAATVLLAPDRRRSIVQLGVGTALAAAIVVPITRSLSSSIVGLAQTRSGERVVAVVTDATFDSLRSTMVVVVLVSLVVALVAHLAGRPAWLRTLAGWQSGDDEGTEAAGVAFIARNHDVLAVVVLALAVVALWVLGISIASVVVTVGLAAALLAVLNAARRRAGDEVDVTDPTEASLQRDP